MTKEEHIDVEASFDGTDLEALTNRVKHVLDIRDRKYGFPSKIYPKCFVGSEAVAQLVSADDKILKHAHSVGHIHRT